MAPYTILYIVLSFIVLDFVIKQILEFLNLRNLKKEVHPKLKDVYTGNRYQQFINYFKNNYYFSLCFSTFTVAIFVTVLSTGFLGVIDSAIKVYVNQPIVVSMIFFAIIYFTFDVLTMPFQLYKIFVIEEKFGFNKMSCRTYIIDKVKHYFLVTIIGGLILFALLFLIQYLGNSFWIYFWVCISAFALFINMFYTTLILPLFNKQTPLQDGELKQAIEEYCRKVSFPLSSIYVIDSSKRSTKSNALFSGMGKKKKIILYDTLIQKHTIDELTAIIAHEVGHYKKRHIIWNYILGILQTGLYLYVASLIIFNPKLLFALGGSSSAIHLNLVAFAILFSPFSEITGVFMNAISRKHEYQADAFVKKTLSDKPLQEALKKLSKNNLGNLNPHWLYVFIHYSHPTLLQRLKALD